MAYNKKSMAKTAANKAVNADKNTTVKNEKKEVGFVFGWLKKTKSPISIFRPHRSLRDRA